MSEGATKSAPARACDNATATITSSEASLSISPLDTMPQ